MKKRILLISFAFLSILMVGCGKEEIKYANDKQEAVEETEIDEVEEVEVVEVPNEEYRAKSIKIEELGDYTLVREVEVKDIFAKNEYVKMTVTDYKLSTLKPKDEYREVFMELETGNQDEIAILDITLTVENLSDNNLEIDYPEGTLFINTEEEVPVILEIFDEKHEDSFKFSGKEVKKGSISTILSSDAEEIESFKLIYDDLELDFK